MLSFDVELLYSDDDDTFFGFEITFNDDIIYIYEIYFNDFWYTKFGDNIHFNVYLLLSVPRMGHGYEIVKNHASY